MAESSALPLSAFPNCGFPEYVDGRYTYLATPEYFAAMGRELALAGAVLVGGSSNMGPKVNRSELKHMHELVETSIKEGATLAFGGQRPDRITSYNVCYTKLLRKLFFVFGVCSKQTKPAPIVPIHNFPFLASNICRM